MEVFAGVTAIAAAPGGTPLKSELGERAQGRDSGEQKGFGLRFTVRPSGLERPAQSHWESMAGPERSSDRGSWTHGPVS